MYIRYIFKLSTKLVICNHQKCKKFIELLLLLVHLKHLLMTEDSVVD